MTSSTWELVGMALAYLAAVLFSIAVTVGVATLIIWIGIKLLQGAGVIGPSGVVLLG